MRWGIREGTSRFGAAAFIADCTFYLTYTSVPLKAISLGAGPIILGLLPALQSTVYIVSALHFGRIAHPGRRMRMARLGVLLLLAGALLLRLAPAIPFLFVFLPIVPIGGALFWPAIQAELGDRGEAATLGRRIGWFNVSWSSGKMLGFLTAGHLAQAFGPGAPLGLAVLTSALLFLVAPWDRPAAAAPTSAPPEDERDAPRDVAERRSFRVAAWAANMVTYGVMGTLIYQFPKRVLSLGLQEGDLGNFLGLVQLTQTLTFVALGSIHGWQRRRASLVVPLLIGTVWVLPITVWRGGGWILACAPGIGVALGFAYSASLYHSLHREADSGRFTGIHEAVLGSGGFVIPRLSGALARTAGLAAPYALCSIALAGATAFALIRLRGVDARRRAYGPSQLVG